MDGLDLAGYFLVDITIVIFTILDFDGENYH